MQLDFTGLDNLAAAGDFQEPATEKQTGPLQRRSDQRKEQLQRAAEVYRRYQESTIATERLQAEILTGIRAGEDLQSLLLKAVKALSLAVNNRELYEQAEKGIAEHYQSGEK